MHEYLKQLIDRYNDKKFGDDFECIDIVTESSNFSNFTKIHKYFYLNYMFQPNTHITILTMICIPEEYRRLGICTALIKYIERTSKSEYLIIGPIMSEEMENLVKTKLKNYKMLPPFTVIKKIKATPVGN